MRVDLDSGKYTVIFEGGEFKALRYGEDWRDLTGDGMVLSMLHEIGNLSQQLATARREGWEQCQNEVMRLMNSGALQNRVDRITFPAGVSIVIADAIAAMEYKGESK